MPLFPLQLDFYNGTKNRKNRSGNASVIVANKVARMAHDVNQAGCIMYGRI